jgi:excisionase family DNA binding protein
MTKKERSLREFGLMTINEVATSLGRHSDFIRDEINRKRLAYYKIGGRFFISQKDLAAYVERSRIAAFGEKATKEVA